MMGETQVLGLVGLGVMGRALAFNLVENGFHVQAFEPLANSADESALAGQFRIHPSLAGCVQAIQPPRQILLLVDAGEPVDALIEQLLDLLQSSDVIIDGSDSHFNDTRRRYRLALAHGISYISLGICGGERGARFGPSLLSGGSLPAYRRIESIFNTTAGKFQGQPCCAYLGNDGVGHFAKMIHNAIEHVDMQLLAECYDLFRALRVENNEIATLMRQWNETELGSYLLEISALIVAERDPHSDLPLLQRVDDRAAQDETAQWAVESALSLGVPAPTLAAAVAARVLSVLKEERIVADRLLDVQTVERRDRAILDSLDDALLMARICAYAQAFALLRAASQTYEWQIPMGRLAQVWRAGSVLRGRLVEHIAEAFDRNSELYHLLLDPYFQLRANRCQLALRRMVATAAALGVPVPAFASALAYFDGYRQANAPASLIQAQRDFVSSEGFGRTDRDGRFHHDWPPVD